MSLEAQVPVQLPRVVIRFCTQCKWNLRAAYYAQELLQTFPPPSLNEIALQPATGGVFTIGLTVTATTATPGTSSPSTNPESSDTTTQASTQHQTAPIVNDTVTTTHLLWDRARDDGFPETKDLKNRVRNVIDPRRDLGHIDRRLKKDAAEVSDGQKKRVDAVVQGTNGGGKEKDGKGCEDCT